MRKSLKLNRGKYDQIILDILRREPCSRKELVEKCRDKGIPVSTIHRRIKQLDKYGLIKIIDLIKITHMFEEANFNEVKDCVETILNKENRDVLFERIKQDFKIFL